MRDSTVIRARARSFDALDVLGKSFPVVLDLLEANSHDAIRSYNL